MAGRGFSIICDMCSRASLIAGENQLKSLFDIEDAFEDVEEYNATPRTLLPVVILKDGKRKLEYMSWGIHPQWDPKRPLCHVRSETALEKPTFRDSVRNRRCLVPVSGFCEWQDKGKPFYFRVNDHELFVLAGTWTTNPSGEFEFAIVTVPSNELIADCYDRMPVIVENPNFDLWLGGDAAEALNVCAHTFPADRMNRYRVDPKVGNVRYHEADALKPYTEQDSLQDRLFG